MDNKYIWTIILYILYYNKYIWTIILYKEKREPAVPASPT